MNKQDGSFLTFEFEAADGIENTTLPIIISCTESNSNSTVDCQEGSVAICGYILGDISGDGRVNNFDVMMQVGYLNDKQQLSDEQLTAADITGDGIVDYLDYSSLASYVVGIYEGLNSDTETSGASLSYASNFVGGANSERAVITASEILDAEPGEYITVDVDMSRNPGLSGYVVSLQYDEKSLELTDIIQKDALSGGKFNTNTGVDGEVTIMWSDAEIRNENGTIFSAVFKVDENAEGELPLILSYNSEHTGYLNDEYISVPVTLMSEDGAIYVDNTGTYMTLSDVAYDNSVAEAVLNIYNSEYSGNVDVLVAGYDVKGNLISVNIQSEELILGELQSIDISVTADNIHTIKVFAFEKDSLRPVIRSKAKIV